MPPRQASQKLQISDSSSGSGLLLWSKGVIEDRRGYKSQHQDDDVCSCLEKRIGPIIGRRNIIKPASDRAKDKKAAGQAAEIMSKMPYERITQQLLDGIHYGYALQCITEWVLEHDLYIPKLSPIHQERVTFVPVETANPLTPVFGGFRLKPEEVLVENGYEIRLKTQANPWQGERLHRDRFVFYSYGSETGEPWGKGLAWRFAPYIEIKHRAWEQWLDARKAAILGKHKSGLTPTQETQLLGQWRAFLSAIAPDAWADMEEGFTAEMIRSGAEASPETQEKLINLCSLAIYKAGLGEVPTSMLNRGSYSMNESQVNDRAAGTTDKDCDNISQALMEQLWKPIGDLNYPSSRYPIVRRWTTEDEAAIAEEKAREESKAVSIGWWEKMMTAGFAPTPENVIATFGTGWTLPGITDSPTPDQPLPDEAIEMAEAPNLDELDDVHKRYKQAVNMSFSELEAWSQNKHSRLAGLDRSPLTRNLRLLKKKKEDWTAKDIKDASKAIAFIAQMKNSGGPGKGSPINQTVGLSRKQIALKNWGYDMDKETSAYSEYLPLFAPYASYLADKSMKEIAQLTGIEEKMLLLAYEEGQELLESAHGTAHQKGMAGVYKAALTW
jgi:hypothetical protein